MSSSHPAPRIAEDADAVARQLLRLGWVVRVVRVVRSQHATADDQAPLLLVSRTAFDAAAATVHVLPHHHLELEAHTGVTVGIDDVQDLHHHLNDLHRQQQEAS